MDNICCGDGSDLNIGSVTNLYVSCCCKCGNNGGEDKPEPPTPEETKIYGIRIDKNNPDPAGRITYTNDAVGMKPAFMNYETGQFDYGDWEDVWFVKENKPVMLNYDGTEAYDLDPNDYSKKLDGTPSDVANPGFPGNAMAKMPLIWMKSWEDDQYEYYNVCQIRPDETYHANAFTRADGSVADRKYLRMFAGSVIAGVMRSVKGHRPMGDYKAKHSIDLAKTNGDGWSIISYSEWSLLDTLLRIMSKTENCQNAYGNGNCSESPIAAALLEAGALEDKGGFYGYASKDGQVKVFHMEALWGNSAYLLEGLINKDQQLYVKPCPPYDLTGMGYVDTGVILHGISGGYVSATKATVYGRMPVESNGKADEYVCDGLYFKSGTNPALVGGSCATGCGMRSGIFCFSLHTGEDITSWDHGAGLSCEQPKTV